MNALEIRNLKKTYKNGVEALKSVDLKVKQGDFFALLGPNGAGKSTLISSIISLVKKESGSIKIFGHDIDQDLSKAKTTIGVVPQEFNFNIFEKVIDIVVTQAGYYGIPKKEATKRAEVILKKLGIWDKKETQSMRLSGGMKRRLMIARALIHKPKLLILDEPTAGVDIELRRTMWDFIVDLNKAGTTIILTTHYLEEAENLCKNIAIIDYGNIIIDTSIKNLLQKVDSQTLILDLANPLDIKPNLESCSCKLIDSLTLEVQISSKKTITELFKALSAHKIKVLNLRNKTNRLEELFVDLVSTEHKEGLK